MRVEHIFDPEMREEFDDWLFEPVDLKPKKKRTPEEEFEIEMARYELGLTTELPTLPILIEEGQVIRFGSDR